MVFCPQMIAFRTCWLGIRGSGKMVAAKPTKGHQKYRTASHCDAIVLTTSSRVIVFSQSLGRKRNPRAHLTTTSILPSPFICQLHLSIVVSIVKPLYTKRLLILDVAFILE